MAVGLWIMHRPMVRDPLRREDLDEMVRFDPS